MYWEYFILMQWKELVCLLYIWMTSWITLNFRIRQPYSCKLMPPGRCVVHLFIRRQVYGGVAVAAPRSKTHTIVSISISPSCHSFPFFLVCALLYPDSPDLLVNLTALGKNNDSLNPIHPSIHPIFIFISLFWVWLCIYGYAEDVLMGDVRRQSGKCRHCAQSLHITNNIGHHRKKTSWQS